MACATGDRVTTAVPLEVTMMTVMVLFQVVGVDKLKARHAGLGFGYSGRVEGDLALVQGLA